MSNNELHLFVFEGARAESKYVDKLEQHFLGQRISVKCVYTENGLLYVSYPMLEAIRHYKDMGSFKNLTVKCKRSNCPYKDDCKDVEACMNEPHYKTISAAECLPQLTNLNKYTKEVWQELIRAHLSKMNYLVNDIFDLPAKLETQSTIFAKQLKKHISHKCPEVAVLSAFPVYVLDYYGVEGVKKKLEE